MAASSKWSLYAGIYSFLGSLALFLPFGFVAGTLLKVLGLSSGLSAAGIPGSAGIIGTIVWWILIERRTDYRYRSGGVFGLVTAISTVLFWTLMVGVVYGPGAVLAAWVVILFVGGMTAPVGFIAGLPLLYARRQATSPNSARSDPVPE